MVEKFVQVYIFEDELEAMAIAADHLDQQARKKESTQHKLALRLPASAFLVYSELRTARRNEEPEDAVVGKLAALPKKQRVAVNRALRLLAERDRLTALSARLSATRKRIEGEFSMASRPIRVQP